MQKHTDTPDSPAWHARRARCFNAGDASAMLGCHPSGKTRTQLLHELHTGIAREFSDYVQERVLDPGHQVEAALRPIAEEILDDELQVLGYSLDVGLSRPLGASLDGSTFLDDTNWECKSANDALRAALPHQGRDSHEHNDASQLPKGYRVQMEQQLMASPAKRTLFSVGQINAAGDVTEERHCWYRPDPALRAEIMGGWRQIDADLAIYVPPAAAAPAPIAKPVASLPVVFDMRVEGKLVSCNLEKYKPAALEYIAAINMELATDQDFVDANADAKYCRDSADKLELAIEQALGQMGDINTALNTVREVAAAFDAKGLALEKLVESQKKTIKESHVLRGQQALREHIASLNERLGRPYMPAIPADFALAVKGLRTVDSVRNAIDSELARGKIAANEVADRLDLNLRHLREHATEFAFLFADTAQIILKPADDLQVLVKSRIDTHEAAEKKKADDLRESIRQEELARIERERQAAEALERRQREEADALAARQAAEAAKPAATPAPAPIASPVVSSQAAAPVSNQPLTGAQAHVGANVVPLSTRPPAADTGATIRLGQINERLSPIQLTAEGLATLGFPILTFEKGAKLYRESDLPHIIAALHAHLDAVQLQQAA